MCVVRWASCASSGCHGSTTPLDTTKVLQNEYYTWLNSDRHAQAYNVLFDERSARIARNMRLRKRAYEEKLCLDCHTTNVPAQSIAGNIDLEDGVQCEVCHGPAGGWRAEHTEEGWTHEQSVARGMIDLRNLPCFVINCPKDTEKRRSMESQLSALGMRFEVVAGLPVQPSWMGVALSHLKVLRLAPARTPFVVLEDDCVFNDLFQPVLEVPAEADALYLGVSVFGLNRPGEFSWGVQNAVQWERYDAAFLRAVAAGEPVHAEVTQERRDGTPLTLELHGIPMQYQGKPHVLTIARDITEKKRSEEELARQRESVRTVEARYVLAGVDRDRGHPGKRPTDPVDTIASTAVDQGKCRSARAAWATCRRDRPTASATARGRWC